MHRNNPNAQQKGKHMFMGLFDSTNLRPSSGPTDMIKVQPEFHYGLTMMGLFDSTNLRPSSGPTDVIKVQPEFHYGLTMMGNCMHGNN